MTPAHIHFEAGYAHHAQTLGVVFLPLFTPRLTQRAGTSGAALTLGPLFWPSWLCLSTMGKQQTVNYFVHITHVPRLRQEHLVTVPEITAPQRCPRKVRQMEDQWRESRAASHALLWAFVLLSLLLGCCSYNIDKSEINGTDDNRSIVFVNNNCSFKGVQIPAKASITWQSITTARHVSFPSQQQRSTTRMSTTHCSHVMWAPVIVDMLLKKAFE